MSSDSNAELESFRRQWQEEVQRRRDVPVSTSEVKKSRTVQPINKDSTVVAPQALSAGLTSRAQDEDTNFGTYDFDDMETDRAAKTVGSDRIARLKSNSTKEPVSALDHYELAVVRETEGKLGDSLELYRKAFRLDDCVDQIYKREHFPPSSFKPKAKDSIPIAVSSKTKEKSTAGSTISTLVASFSDASILGIPPMISGDISPPCPIKDQPSELLIDVIDYVAKIDVATLSALAQVSKRFAYIIATQDSIWRKLIHGPRFGLGGMHYAYAKEVSGAPLELSLADLSLNPSVQMPRVLPVNLPLNASYPTYRHMFQHRPRIRFSGVYISTVNYTRPGASGPNTLTWNTPIHVVTYYRYLRFYRDGSCISLLTTVEPLDVVPYLQKENIGGETIATTTLPVGVMRDARRGRWKISSPQELISHERQPKTDSPETINTSDLQDSPPSKATTNTTSTTTHPPPPIPISTQSKPQPQSQPSSEPEPESTTEAEGILTIEHEGAAKAYQYTARFEIQSTGTGAGKNSNSRMALSARNTKLAWRGFWSYNLITGDWAEFGLRNDKAFVWSRVRSWADA